MALTLNNFIGFETGGLEEAESIAGTPSVQAFPRSGTYSLRFVVSGELYYASAFENGTSDEGDDYIVGFATRFLINPSAFSYLLRARGDADNVHIGIAVNADGFLELYNSAAAKVDTGTIKIVTGQWYYIELRWQNNDNGSADVYLDGVSEMSATSDFLAADTFNRYSLERALGNNYADDFYCMSGAGGVGDFLGTGVEVLGAYQNTVEDATDQGDALEIGTWAITGDTPGVDDGTPAEYTGNPKSGYTICDEGDRDGPAADLDGTAKGAKWIHRLLRGGGGGTTQHSLCGKNTSVSESADLDITTAFVNYMRILTDTTYMPNANTDNFAQGIKVVGAQDLVCADMWAMLLHIAPGEEPPAGQPTQVRTQGVPTGSGSRDRAGRWN